MTSTSGERPDTSPDRSLERRFTISELAEASGTPVRRIRYYQAQELLDPPHLVGRTGFYGTNHLQRLWAIASLRHRGIETSSIREILADSPLDPSTALRQWIEATEPEESTDPAKTVELTRQELEAKMQGLPDDTLDRLISSGLVQVIDDADPPRYLAIPAGCDLTLDLERTTGIPLQITAEAGRMIARHAEALAEELGSFALAQVGNQNLATLDIRLAQQHLMAAAVRASSTWLHHHMNKLARLRFDALDDHR